MDIHVGLNRVDVLKHIQDVHLLFVTIRIEDVVQGYIVFCCEAENFAVENALRKGFCDFTANEHLLRRVDQDGELSLIHI